LFLNDLFIKPILPVETIKQWLLVMYVLFFFFSCTGFRIERGLPSPNSPNPSEVKDKQLKRVKVALNQPDNRS
jgi:hypothetical protein